MKRTFILREQAHFDNCTAALRQNWRAMSEMGTPLQVTVAPWRRPRSLEQNALMWVWLGQLESEAWIAGRRFDAETWNEHLKREFLPEQTASGKDKWRILPTGERVLAISTTDLNASEMATYMTQMQAWAATELGVTLDVLAREAA